MSSTNRHRPPPPDPARSRPLNTPEKPPIFNSLSHITSTRPATDLIKALLECVANDTAQLTPHLQFTGHVLENSHTIYLAIQTLIANVDRSQTPDWDSFDKYTTAISPLEDLLLEFKLSTQDSPSGYLPPYNPSDAQVSISSIVNWEENRKAIINTSKKLSNAGFLSLSPTLRDQIAQGDKKRVADDIAALQTFGRDNLYNLRDADVSIRPGFQLVSGIKTAVSNILKILSNLPPSEPSARIVIKTLMLVYIPFPILADKSANGDLKLLMKGVNIWEAMHKLLQDLTKFLQPGGTPVSPVAVEEQWQEVARLFLKSPDPILNLSGEMLQLMKLAATVRRPFHGRSVELIQLIRQLDLYSSQAINRPHTDRNNLRKVMTKANGFIAEAARTVPDVKSFSPASPEFAGAEGSLLKVLEDIESCYRDFLIDNADTVKGRYNEAVKKDNDNFIRMRTRLGLT